MKIAGFYRVIETFPAPVVPILQQAEGGRYYAQELDKSGCVVSFVPAARLDPSRLLVEGEYAVSDVSIGDRGLFAIAYNSTRILVNNAQVVRREVRQYLYENRGNILPFAELEMALFTGDASLIEDAAERCRLTLEKTGTTVTNLWIDGAPLADDLKWKLRNRQIHLDGTTPPISVRVRLGFTSARRLMLGLTDFCFNHLRLTRATVIRELFSGSEAAERIYASTLRVNEVVNELADLYRKEAPRFAWPASRGRVTLDIFDISSYRIATERFHEAVAQADSYAILRSSVFYSAGVESSNFIMLLCMMMEYRDDFVEYYKRLLSSLPND